MSVDQMSVDLFIVQVDGLDVSFTHSRQAALEHCRRLAAEDPELMVRVLRVQDGIFQVIALIPPAEAATAY